MAKTKLRILCLGASLVAGYSSMGAVYHPFSHHLAKVLGTIMPEVEVETIVDGVPGDRVTTGTFLERMQKHFTESSEPFDWTIVLGATNDIAFFVEVEKIMDKFKEIWAIPLSRGSKVLALTVPRATVDRDNPRLVEQRNALNKRIMDHTTDNFHVFDLHGALPYDTGHAKYWDDAIHFTPAGYDFIGNKVGIELMKLIIEARSKDS